MRMTRFVIAIMGCFIILVGIGSIIWNTEEDEQTTQVLDEKGELTQQLEAFLDNDQLEMPDDERKSIERVFEEEQTQDSIASNQVNVLSHHSIKATEPKEQIVQKQPVSILSVTPEQSTSSLSDSTNGDEIIEEEQVFRKQSTNTSSVNREESDSFLFESANGNEIIEEEEIAYEDAYLRSLYDDPYEREFILNDENAEHWDLAAALTKLDVDHAVKNKDIKSLQRWLDIFTVVKYPATREQFKASYTGTKAYLRKALKQLKATN